MNFDFGGPKKVIFENGSSLKVGNILKEMVIEKVLCVFDKGVETAGITGDIIERMKMLNIDVSTYNGVISDPPKKIVKEIYEIGKKNKVEAVIAIGGGSSIDAAKVGNVLLTNEASLEDILEYKVSIKNPGKLFIAIPTTAGTGSEVTNAAVITDEDVHKKMLLLSNILVPDIAVIDPVLAEKLPLSVTVSTGMDVFSHAYEAFTSERANPLSDMVALSALKLVIENLPCLVEKPDETSYRANMSYASMLAGYALNGAGAGMGHFIAHALGAKWHVPHGFACALVSPVVIEELTSQHTDKAATIAKLLGVYYGSEALGNDLKKAFENFNGMVGVPSFKAMNINPSKNTEITAAIVDDIVGMSSMSGIEVDETAKENLVNYYTDVVDRIIC